MDAGQIAGFAAFIGIFYYSILRILALWFHKRNLKRKMRAALKN
jgi:hypothetical protein